MHLQLRLANNTDPHSWASRLRRKRFELVHDLIARPGGPVTVLDVGGSAEFWEMARKHSEIGDEVDITLLNLYENSPAYPRYKSAVGDARSMPQYGDNEFDLVFSNSTIEHVGDFDDQRRMAEEVQRVGRRYYVQTPNRFFPIEPHYMFPLFQFLPVAVRAALVERFKLGWMPRHRGYEAAKDAVQSIQLLKKSDIKELFPKAMIAEERFAGMTKSLIAYSA